MSDSKSIIKYKDSVTLTTKQATEMLRSIWPGAPLADVAKAAMICQTYGLNPLMRHIFLIEYKKWKKVDGKKVDTGERTWAIVIARKAARIMAARKKPFSYIDDSPRIMVTGEPEKYFGENDPEKLYSITILQDEHGNVARGYGFWNKFDEPYGEEKGNSKANMAHLRSEGQAIDRMVPDTLPPDIDIIDKRFVEDMPSFDVETTATEILPEQLANGNMCPLHNVPWEKKSGKKGTWFSHKTPDGWCNKSEVDKLAKETAEVPPARPQEVMEPLEKIGTKGLPTLLKDRRFASVGAFLQACLDEVFMKSSEVFVILNINGPQELVDLTESWNTLIHLKGRD